LERGNALQAKGNIEAAIAEYREALRLKPDYADAHYNLGLMLEAKGQPLIVEYSQRQLSFETGSQNRRHEILRHNE